jgi:hypothetical protein
MGKKEDEERMDRGGRGRQEITSSSKQIEDDNIGVVGETHVFHNGPKFACGSSLENI